MSRAIDLYKIVSGGVTYLLTSAVKEQIHQSGPGGSDETYVPAPIGRGGITSKSEISKANIDVRIALDHALAQSLLSEWVETRTTITIFRKRTADTSVIWKGRLSNIVPDDAHLKMVFESIYTSLRRPGLRARMLKSCRHPLYGRGCFVVPADHATAATVTTIVGVTVTCTEADALPDGWFTGGMLEAPNGTKSYIAEHVGAVLTLNRISGALADAFNTEGPGLAITLYPGCAHDYVTCRDKFDNEDNYGGFDYIPTKNPMGGSSIV